MTKRLLLPLALIALLPLNADARGRIRVILPGQTRPTTLAVDSQTVEVEIDNQVAITRVTQVFRNDSNQDLTGSYLFERPRGARIFRFVTWIDGKRKEGKILEKRQARQEFEQARRQGKKAALVEHRGADTFGVTLHPIKARATQKIELSYMQVLRYDDGKVAYRYPLERKARQGKFRFSLKLTSRVPLSTAFASGLPLKITRASQSAEATFSAEGQAFERDAEFTYLLSRKQTGMDLIAHRGGEGDGHFLLLITPKEKIAPGEVQAKDMTFILDVSGSMGGTKIVQARQALGYCIRSLKPKDRFNIVTFSRSASAYSPRMLHPTMANMRAAEQFVSGLRAGGGTNIDAALVKALEVAPKEGKRAHLVVFLTDGRATQGETRPDQIIRNAMQRIAANVRLYTFGIGHDLNETMLRRLAARTRGASTFVRDGGKLELRVSSFQKAISHPVLSDLKLDFGKLGAKGVYPRDITYLFAGRQLMVLGRYARPGKHQVTLRAQAKGRPVEITGSFDFPAAQAAHAHLPRLYAAEKIRYLLEEIALHRAGREELTREVIRLSKQANVASPYTSFLVVVEGQARPDADDGMDAKADKAPRRGRRAQLGKSLGGRGGGGGFRANAAKKKAPAGKPMAPPRSKGARPGNMNRFSDSLREDARRVAPSAGPERFHAALGKAKLPEAVGEQLWLAYALAQSGTSREFGESKQQLAALLEKLHAALSRDARLGGKVADMALACATLARLHEIGGADADLAMARRLLAALAKAVPADDREAALLALAFDRARRAGIDLPKRSATSLKAAAAKAATATKADRERMLFEALAAAGTPKATRLRARIQALYAKGDLASCLAAALADGALYAYR